MLSVQKTTKHKLGAFKATPASVTFALTAPNFGENHHNNAER